VSAGEEILIRAEIDYVESRGVETVNYAGLPETTKAKLKAFGVSEVNFASGEDSQGESQMVGSDKISQAKLNESHWKLASIYRLNGSTVMELNEKGLIAKDGSENYYTLYTYNDDNVMVSAETYNAYDGEPVLVSYYKYNDDGSMAEQYSFDTKILYSYYSDGTLKREEKYVNLYLSYYQAPEYPDEWSYFSSIDYNEHGDEVYGESYGSIYAFTNGYGMDNYSYSYEYDSDGRKLSDSVDGFAHTYEYDENKNLISVSTIREDSGARSPYDEAHYEYELINGEYKVVYSLVYKNSEYGLYTDETTCRYDDLGQKIYEYIKTVYVDSDGNPWDDKFDYSENEYEYDEYGYKCKVNGSYAYTKFYDEKGTYNSTYTYSPETFPAEGKRGDLFTRTMTYESGDYSYSEVSVYRYVD